MTWTAPLLAVSLAALPAPAPDAGTGDGSVAQAAATPPAVPNQTLVFFNARLAFRERAPLEVLKLWLLHNSLAQQGQQGRHEAEFRSVVWAALGELGLCPDGFRTDEAGGAALWPVALHNLVVQNLGKGEPPDRDSPYSAFDLNFQQRFVSLHDVLSLEELRSVAFQRTSCSLPEDVLGELAEPPNYDPNDRAAMATLMRRSLAKALASVDRKKVRNLPVLEARLLDLDLAVERYREAKARQDRRAARQNAYKLGAAAQATAEARAGQGQPARTKEQERLLRGCLSWPPAEWLNLSRARRLSLFSAARPLSADPLAVERVVLGIVDGLIERGEGEEIEQWVGMLDPAGAPAFRRALVTGERGRRLLELPATKGFRARSAIALNRGAAFLEAGQREDALRSFAFAIAYADEAADEAVTRALARRWLSYVLAQYQTDEAVVATLKALVPKREYNAVVADLLWRAALRVDERSFELVAASVVRGAALDARITRLRLLAKGESSQLLTQLRADAADEPFLTLRFVREVLEQLESEDANVRLANAPLLRLLVKVVDTAGAQGDGRGAQVRAAEEMLARIYSILDGLAPLETLAAGASARTLSPKHEAFAGSIRLAPADPLPWPFNAKETEAPSVFVPVVLEPAEWLDEKGAVVYGWRLHDPP
ncbi:MAG: hypothetical protein QM765_39590 [Myxococcales bacterium]